MDAVIQMLNSSIPSTEVQPPLPTNPTTLTLVFSDQHVRDQAVVKTK